MEDTGRVRKKKDKKKRKLTLDEVVKSEAELKKRAEELVIKQPAQSSEQDQSKLTVAERLRGAIHGMFYRSSNQPPLQVPAGETGPQPATPAEK